MTTTTTGTDLAVVDALFAAFAQGDLAGFADRLEPDEGDRVRSFDQFVGDPGAVTALWA